MAAVALDEDAVAGEFLTFQLGSEDYAIDILKVQEIRGYQPPTTIANAPPFLKGVIDLRGTIVPIIDMRIKFSLGQAEYTPFTVVIILRVRNRIIGIVVDGVSDVVLIPRSAIRPAPEFAASVDASYVPGLATVGERMLVVADIERLMLRPEMALAGLAPESPDSA